MISPRKPHCWPYQFPRHGIKTSLVPVMMNFLSINELFISCIVLFKLRTFVVRPMHVCAETQLFSGWYRNAIVFGCVLKRNSFRFLPWRTSVSAKSPRYAKTSLWFVFRSANKVRGAHTLVICLYAARLVFVRTCALLKSNSQNFRGWNRKKIYHQANVTNRRHRAFCYPVHIVWG